LAALATRGGDGASAARHDGDSLRWRFPHDPRGAGPARAVDRSRRRVARARRSRRQRLGRRTRPHDRAAHGTHLDRPEDWRARPHDLASLASWELGRRDAALAHAFAAVEAEPDDDRLVANARWIQLATAPARVLSAGPLVDVVILAVSRTPGAYTMTRDAIASLRASSPDVPMRVVVVETHAGLAQEPWARDDEPLFGPDVEVVYPGGRFGYNRYVLAGFARAGDDGAPYAMVLNNDVTLFAPGFLRTMLDGLQKVPSVSPLGYREARWNGIDASVPLVENYFVGSALSGWCVMFDRAILDAVPLDELFPPALPLVLPGCRLRRDAGAPRPRARLRHRRARAAPGLAQPSLPRARRSTPRPTRASVHWTLGVRPLAQRVVGDGAEADAIASELAAYRTTALRASGMPADVDDRSLDRAWIAPSARDLPALLRAWEPKLARGGWLAGPGYDDAAVRSAVDAFSREILTPLAFVTRDGTTWRCRPSSRRCGRRTELRVFDAFPFFNELEMLEIRLNVLGRGRRPLRARRIHADLQRAAQAVVVRRASRAIRALGRSHRARHRRRRARHREGLLGTRAPPARSRRARARGLPMRRHRPALRCRRDPRPRDRRRAPARRVPPALLDVLPQPRCNRACAGSVPSRSTRSSSPRTARRTRGCGRGAFEIVEGGGWHFAYAMPPDRIREKLHAFSHAEHDTPENAAAVESRRDSLVDLFRAHPGQLVVQDIESDAYPAYLRENWRRHASLVRQPFGGPSAAAVGAAGHG
jgi:hypothetical protein